ncbi:MAG: hypothetical protein QXO67_04085 [Candidatus Bathyarchaeia archaeon]
MSIKLDRSKLLGALGKWVDLHALRGYIAPLPVGLTEDPAANVFTHTYGLYWFLMFQYRDLLYMFYNHGISGAPNLPKQVGLAKSRDGGLTWEVVNDAILSLGAPGAWDDNYIEAHSLVRIGNKWRLYYGGQDGTNWRIGFAEATNIEGPYTKYAGNPVFNLGASGQWDAGDVADPHVIWYRGRFHLYYAGEATAGTPPWKVGHATSLDGISWTRDAANPVIDVASGTWRQDTVVFGGVLIMPNGGLMAICHGRNTTAPDSIPLGLFFSDDGSAWSEYPANPILGGVGTGLKYVHPEIILDVDRILVFYSRADLTGNPVRRAIVNLYP